MQAKETRNQLVRGRSPMDAETGEQKARGERGLEATGGVEREVKVRA